MRHLPIVALVAATLAPAVASAQDPYLGEIRCFGYNFMPRGWAAADGRLLPIAQNSALFSLLGTQFGGDGRTNFALPDLRGRSIVGVGQGPGLQPISGPGEQGGVESVTLTQAQLPPHAHGVAPKASPSTGTAGSPAGAVPAARPNFKMYGDPAAATATMAATTTSSVGGGQPVAVRSPYLAMTCAIAVEGIYPSRE